VSPKHANFVVNDRKGRAADVRGLIDDVAAAVAAETGIVLEPEVVFLGDWDPPVVPGDDDATASDGATDPAEAGE
jgi:UDP-N-acetylmuramate dehydrogenase